MLTDHFNILSEILWEILKCSGSPSVDTYNQEDSAEGIIPVEEGGVVNRGKRRGSPEKNVVWAKTLRAQSNNMVNSIWEKQTDLRSHGGIKYYDLN